MLRRAAQLPYPSLLSQNVLNEEKSRHQVARSTPRRAKTAFAARWTRPTSLHPEFYTAFYIHSQPTPDQFTILAGYQGTLLPIVFDLVAPDD
jgi:hypothetical protein